MLVMVLMVESLSSNSCVRTGPPRFRVTHSSLVGLLLSKVSRTNSLFACLTDPLLLPSSRSRQDSTLGNMAHCSLYGSVYVLYSYNRPIGCTAISVQWVAISIVQVDTRLIYILYGEIVWCTVRQILFTNSCCQLSNASLCILQQW